MQQKINHVQVLDYIKGQSSTIISKLHLIKNKRLLHNFFMQSKHFKSFISEQNIDQFIARLVQQLIFKQFSKNTVICHYTQVQQNVCFILSGSVLVFEKKTENDIAQQKYWENQLDEIRVHSNQRSQSNGTKTENQQIQKVKDIYYYYRNLESEQLLKKEKSEMYFIENLCLFKFTTKLEEGDCFGPFTSYQLGSFFAGPDSDVFISYISRSQYQKIFSQIIEKCNSINRIFQSAGLFSFNQQDCYQLANSCQLNIYNNQFVIFQEGQKLDQFYFIKNGKVILKKKNPLNNLIKQDQQQDQSDKSNCNKYYNEIILTTYNEIGEQFGHEFYAISKSEYQCTAISASEQLTVLSISANIFFQYCSYQMHKNILEYSNQFVQIVKKNINLVFKNSNGIINNIQDDQLIDQKLQHLFPIFVKKMELLKQPIQSSSQNQNLQFNKQIQLRTQSTNDFIDILNKQQQEKQEFKNQEDHLQQNKEKNIDDQIKDKETNFYNMQKQRFIQTSINFKNFRKQNSEELLFKQQKKDKLILNLKDISSLKKVLQKYQQQENEEESQYQQGKIVRSESCKHLSKQEVKQKSMLKRQSIVDLQNSIVSSLAQDILQHNDNKIKHYKIQVQEPISPIMIKQKSRNFDDNNKQLNKDRSQSVPSIIQISSNLNQNIKFVKVQNIHETIDVNYLKEPLYIQNKILQQENSTNKNLTQSVYRIQKDKIEKQVYDKLDSIPNTLKKQMWETSGYQPNQILCSFATKIDFHSRKGLSTVLKLAAENKQNLH